MAAVNRLAAALYLGSALVVLAGAGWHSHMEAKQVSQGCQDQSLGMMRAMRHVPVPGHESLTYSEDTEESLVLGARYADECVPGWISALIGSPFMLVSLWLLSSLIHVRVFTMEAQRYAEAL